MVSTVASAALGFGFWVVAARLFPADVVGRASALVASVTLLAGLAQLNLVSLFARFLPGAGSGARRLVGGGAGASVAMAVLLSAGYLGLGFGRGLVGDGTLWWVAFTVAVAASGLYFIVDGVLTPLGRATWVPVKNVLTAGGKLALLAMLALVAPAALATGMLAAWMVPVTVSVVVAGGLILFRLTGRPTDRPAGPVAPRREIASFVSAEYVNGIVANAVAFVPPVLVAHALGTTVSAYFYIPWIIGVAATTLLWNVVTSFVVAASEDGAAARVHLGRAVRLGLAVLVPGTVTLVVAAEPLLGVLGPEYAAQGATALRLIGASLPFTGVLMLYAAFCVMNKRMWTLTALQGAGAAVVLVGGSLGLERLGGTAPALAYLVGQALVALAVLPAVLRTWRAVGTGERRPAWVDSMPAGQPAR
jgi:O-antigen/teichoic acid export membrane protein